MVKSQQAKRTFFFAWTIISLVFYSFPKGSLVAAETSSAVFPASPSAGVEDISDQNYLQKAREVIGRAHQSVDLSLSKVAILGDQNDPVELLIEDLIKASKRGVKVRLFLNTFSEEGFESSLFLKEDVLEALRQGGVRVHFVNPQYRLYDQLLIADRAMVLEGGPPWIRQALKEGLSSATLSHSEALAQKKRMRMELLPLWDVQVQKEERTDGRLAIPIYLFQEIRYFPAMVKFDDGDALKIYLTLLRFFYEHHDAEFDVELEELVNWIPADRYFEKSAVAFQVLKTIHRLSESYELLEIQDEQPDRMSIRMRLPRNLEPVVGIPVPFFEENYSKELSPRAIFAYGVIRYRMQATGQSPVWLGTARNVEQDFPMTEENFHAAVKELRAQNLIEVFPFKLQQGDFYHVPETIEYRYLVNPIRSLSERLATWTRLREEYNEDRFVQARDAATLLGEAEDPKVIVTYLKLLEKYPVEDIMGMTQHLAALQPQSTPALLEYLEQLLKYESQKNYQLAIP